MPALSRRTLLKGSGAALALPLPDAMRPAFGRAADPMPRRLVAICTNLGVYEPNFLPATAGHDFALTPYLEPFADLRDQVTVVSGTSHPEVGNGHSAEASFLTAAPHPGTASFKNSISLDQFAAERIGVHTRVAALPLVVSKRGNQSISFTSSGVMVPAEGRPAKVYRQLFVAGDAKSVERQLHDLRTGRSILDSVADRAESLRRSLGPGDQGMGSYLDTSHALPPRGRPEVGPMGGLGRRGEAWGDSVGGNRYGLLCAAGLALAEFRGFAAEHPAFGLDPAEPVLDRRDSPQVFVDVLLAVESPGENPAGERLIGALQLSSSMKMPSE